MKALTARFLLPIEGEPVEDAALLVEDGKIVEVGERRPLLSRYPKAAVEEFPDCVLMPGLVNAHTHLELLNFDWKSERRKVPGDTEFLNWVLAAWDYRRELSLAERRRALEEGTRQLLRFGTTTVGDVGRYAGLLPDLIKGPLRMVLFPELFTGGEPTSPGGYEAVFAEVEEIRGARSPRLTVGIAPYAAYTLSRHVLKIVARQAQAMQLPLKIHAAETFGEIEFFYESKGEIAEKLFPRFGWGELPPAHRKTPVEYLESIGFLETAPALIGCHHLSGPDLQILVRRGAKVIWSPCANAHWKLASPPLKRLRTAGVPVALGTDSTAAIHSLSLWDEMRFIGGGVLSLRKTFVSPPPADDPKVSLGPPLPLSADELLRMATLEGAKAVGLADRIGSLKVGKEADLIAVRVPRGLTPKEIPPWLVSNVTDREISAVFVAGNRVSLA